MDEVDRAQVWEEREREAAIAAARTRSTVAPLVVHGVRFCRGCHGAIAQARIDAVPSAVLCLDCAVDAEIRSGGR